MFSWFAARISRHCTRGSPASDLTENWRKKMAISLVFTLPEPKVGRANSFPFSLMAPGVMRSRRNCCASICLLPETRSPETFCPSAFFPENVKTGMEASPDYRSCTHDLNPAAKARGSSHTLIQSQQNLTLHRGCAFGQWSTGGGTVD